MRIFNATRCRTLQVCPNTFSFVISLFRISIKFHRLQNFSSTIISSTLFESFSEHERPVDQVYDVGIKEAEVKIEKPQVNEKQS